LQVLAAACRSCDAYFDEIRKTDGEIVSNARNYFNGKIQCNFLTNNTLSERKELRSSGLKILRRIAVFSDQIFAYTQLQMMGRDIFFNISRDGISVPSSDSSSTSRWNFAVYSLVDFCQMCEKIVFYSINYFNIYKSIKSFIKIIAWMLYTHKAGH